MRGNLHVPQLSFPAPLGGEHPPVSLAAIVMVSFS